MVSFYARRAKLEYSVPSLLVDLPERDLRGHIIGTQQTAQEHMGRASETLSQPLCNASVHGRKNCTACTALCKQIAQRPSAVKCHFFDV